MIAIGLGAAAHADPKPRVMRPDGARLDAAAQAELGEARALLAAADVHERAGRLGSAYRAVTRAYALATTLADPIGFYRCRNPSALDTVDLLAHRPQLLKEADATSRAAQQRQLTLLHASFWAVDLAGLTYPSQIEIELDGKIVPMDDWRGSIPIDGGSHEWIARMDNFVFWRHQEHVPSAKGSIRIAPVFPFDAPPPVNPPPVKAPPRSQIAR